MADLKRRNLLSRVSGYYCIENKLALDREIDAGRGLASATT